MTKNALLIVDIQNDFVPGGALAIKEGDTVIPIIDALLKKPFDVKLASKDWHPADHQSFATTHQRNPGEVLILNGLEQILWPIHCVENSYGSEFAPGWDTTKIDRIFYKGIDKNMDSYSTFFDNGHVRSTGLYNYLKQHDITDLYIAGLATDYCVKYSVQDACHLGFNVFVIVDACRGVDLHPEDSKRALEAMQLAGAHLIYSKDIAIN